MLRGGGASAGGRGCVRGVRDARGSERGLPTEQRGTHGKNELKRRGRKLGDGRTGAGATQGGQGQPPLNFEGRRAALGANFAHQADEIFVGVAEEGHPEIVVGHLCGELRGAFVFRAAGDDGGVGRGKVVDFEVERGVFAGFTVALRRGEHEANAAGGEECEVGAGGEEETEAEDIAVEGGRDGDVADGDRDLTNVGEGGVHGRRWNHELHQTHDNRKSKLSTNGANRRRTINAEGLPTEHTEESE